MTPRPGVDAASRECFELLELSIDGRPLDVRRAARKSGQTYSVTIPEEVVAGQSPVRVRHIYRVVTPTWGHRLFVQMPQPVRNLSLSMDYTSTAISHMSVTDIVSSSAGTQIHRLPQSVAAKKLTVDIPGWLLPRSGFAFTWTLDTELPQSERSEAA